MMPTLVVPEVATAANRPSSPCSAMAASRFLPVSRPRSSGSTRRTSTSITWAAEMIEEWASSVEAMRSRGGRSPPRSAR